MSVNTQDRESDDRRRQLLRGHILFALLAAGAYAATHQFSPYNGRSIRVNGLVLLLRLLPPISPYIISWLACKRALFWSGAGAAAQVGILLIGTIGACVLYSNFLIVLEWYWLALLTGLQALIFVLSGVVLSRGPIHGGRDV
jgi:hypothetical protein